MPTESPEANLRGKLVDRQGDGFEAARRAAVWNGLKPDRSPDLILLAKSAEDVVEGVRLANREGHRIGIRAGGHNFTGTGVRDGGLLIDMASLDGIEVDASDNTAWIGPAVRPENLEKELTKEGLFFPYGGCRTIGLGGYMLSGGYGLNGKTYGAAGTNIRALDLVTADGELIRADATQNTDYLWAARGGGYAFPGAIVRFQIDLFPAPKLITETTLHFSLDDFPELMTWFFSAMDDLDRAVSTFIFGHKDHEGVTPDGSNLVTIFCVTFTDTREEADRILKPILTASVMDRALTKEIAVPITIPELWDDIDLLYPEGKLYVGDTFWIEDPQSEGFIAALESAFRTLPSPGSHILLNPWIPEPRDDVALSGTTTLPVHMYGVYDDSSEEDTVRGWVRDEVKPMLPYGNGIGKINESELLLRDQKHLGDVNLAKHNELRAKYDPEQRFHDLLR
jgi:FAD binding domain-containing protein